MSRSYKKTPWAGDKKGTEKKRIAWKAVRQYLKEHPDEVLIGNNYKKLYPSYDICDYGWMRTWEEYWSRCQQFYEERVSKGWENQTPPNKDEEYRRWLKYYHSK